VDVWMWLNNKVAMYAGKEKIELAGAGIGTWTITLKVQGTDQVHQDWLLNKGKCLLFSNWTSAQLNLCWTWICREPEEKEKDHPSAYNGQVHTYQS
jgi:hypothetical protein